jgi:hypothetical protein
MYLDFRNVFKICKSLEAFVKSFYSNQMVATKINPADMKSNQIQIVPHSKKKKKSYVVKPVI